MRITIFTKYIVYNHYGIGVRHHHFTNTNIVHQFPDQHAQENEIGNRLASASATYSFNIVGKQRCTNLK